MYREIIGIIASAFVLVSFLFKGELKIRYINVFGCLIFVIYGILIKSFSVYFMNGALVLVHIYFIFKIKSKKK